MIFVYLNHASEQLRLLCLTDKRLLLPLHYVLLWASVTWKSAYSFKLFSFFHHIFHQQIRFMLIWVAFGLFVLMECTLVHPGCSIWSILFHLLGYLDQKLSAVGPCGIQTVSWVFLFIWGNHYLLNNTSFFCSFQFWYFLFFMLSWRWWTRLCV